MTKALPFPVDRPCALHAMPVLKVSAECKSFLFFADVWRLYIDNARDAKAFLTENSLKKMVWLSV